jgi:hypothetical protein
VIEHTNISTSDTQTNSVRTIDIHEAVVKGGGVRFLNRLWRHHHAPPGTPTPASTPGTPGASAGQTTAPSTGSGPVRITGRTRWRRFTALLAPALGVVALMVIGVLHGALPVSAALRGKTNIKLSIQRLSTNAGGSFPRFFQTRDGDRHTVVAVALRDTWAVGLCASGKVSSPLGSRVLRITTQPGQRLQLSELQLALESIDDVEVAGGAIALGRGGTTTIKGLGDIPVQTGQPGTLPITATNLKLRIHGQVRWVTASGLKLAGITMTMGGEVKECF